MSDSTEFRYPPQSRWVGYIVGVSLDGQNYDRKGTLLRNDLAEPYRVIIQLDTGEVLTGSECLYQLVTIQAGV